jgi:putative transposase
VFLYDSEGFYVEHPEFYFSELSELQRLSRNLSRKKLGSRNRWKAKRTLRKWHDHIRNRRDYFLWGLARFYATNYKAVTVYERLWRYKIEYALTAHEAIRLCDGAYARFAQMLEHKCNEFGTSFILRKDQKWQREKEQLTERAKREALAQLLRKARRAVQRNYLRRFRSLEQDCKRLTMLRIC